MHEWKTAEVSTITASHLHVLALPTYAREHEGVFD
jgi:hypothetical protein